MAHKARRFAKETVIYSAQPFLAKIIAILLVPVYTAYLTTAEYGQFSFIFSIGSFISPLINMGLTTSFWKYWTALDNRKPEVLYWVLILKIAAGTLITAILAIIYGVITSFSLEAVLAIVYIAGLTVGTVFSTAQLYFRATHKSVTYLVMAVLNSLILVLLNILFVVVFKLSYFGVIMGSFCTSLFFGIIAFFMIRRHINHQSSKRLPRLLLAYGTPMILTNISGVILIQSDRLMLRFLVGFAELGSYSYAYRFGAVFYGFLLAPFFLSWNPIRWEICERKDAKEVFSKISNLFTRFVPSISIFSSGVIILVAKGLTMSSEYMPSLYLVPVIAMSYAFYGMYYFETMGLLFVNKTKYIASFSMIAAIVNIVLNVILISLWGYWGAAIATLLSYILLRFLAVYGSQKHYPIERNTFMEIVSIMIPLIALAIALLLFKGNYVLFALSLILYGLVYATINYKDLLSLLALLRKK